MDSSRHEDQSAMLPEQSGRFHGTMTSFRVNMLMLFKNNNCQLMGLMLLVASQNEGEKITLIFGVAWFLGKKSICPSERGASHCHLEVKHHLLLRAWVTPVLIFECLQYKSTYQLELNWFNSHIIVTENLRNFYMRYKKASFTELSFLMLCLRC